MSRALPVVFVGLILVGCGTSPTTVDDPPESVPLTIQVALAGFPIEQVVVSVSGPGIPDPGLAFNLTLADSTASGTIEVPAGSDRQIVVTAFDAGGIPTHQGSATLAIEPGTNPNVILTLDALQGSLPIEAHIGTLLVIVEPALDTILVGDTLRLMATVVSGGVDTLDVQVRWATLNPALAWVDTTGLVTALGAGEVGVVATYAGVAAQTTIVIEPLGFFATILAGGGTGSGGGADHTCALTPVGEAYCWGENTFGELGSSDSTFSSVPLAVDGGLSFESLSVGGMHNCGITDVGGVHCWGYNTYGQIGDDSQTNAFAPIAVADTLGLTAVSPGGFTTCSLDAAGDLYCWGWGDSGERADGVRTQVQTTPVGPAGPAFAQVSVGAYHACGLLDDGTAYCWGRDSDGQLGIAGPTNDTCANTDPCQTVPTPVNTGLRFFTIDPGGLWRAQEHTCALDESGVAYCWGNNDYGQLGDASTTSASQPVPVGGGLTFQQISTLGEFTCGVVSDGFAYCWGRNDFGQLGNGSADPFSATPVQVGDGTLKFLSVSVGSHHACGVSEDGDAYCWGRNSEGALGDGTRDDSGVPVLVVTPG